MREKLFELFPEFSLFKNEELKQKTMNVFVKAMERGGWQPEDLVEMPFTLLIKPCPANMVQHIRGVTLVSYKSAQELKEIYGDKMDIDMDELLCGAILHDIGKLLEYVKENGEFVKSSYGKLLRHPFSGMALAFEEGLSPKVQHMIAVHAREGEKSRVCAESIIVHHADFTNFEPLKL
ncbi:HD domain-containing protein [bacterium]|nr:HD domain-containing protein [bacterium]